MQMLINLGYKVSDRLELANLRIKLEDLQTESETKSKTIAALKARLKECGCADE